MSITAADPTAAPYSAVNAYLIEANYRAIGCDGWNTRRVERLCGKLGDTPVMLAARLRIGPAEMARKMASDRWTKQDALILTVIEREADFLKGGLAPKGALLPEGRA